MSGDLLAGLLVRLHRTVRLVCSRMSNLLSVIPFGSETLTASTRKASIREIKTLLYLETTDITKGYRSERNIAARGICERGTCPYALQVPFTYKFTIFLYKS